MRSLLCVYMSLTEVTSTRSVHVTYCEPNREEKPAARSILGGSLPPCPPVHVGRVERLYSVADFSNVISNQELKQLAEADDQEVVREIQVSGPRNTGQWSARYRSVVREIQVSGPRDTGQWSARYRSVVREIQVSGRSICRRSAYATRPQTCVIMT